MNLLIKSPPVRMALVIAAFTLIGAGCSVKVGPQSPATPPGGGVYKSTDQGRAWQQVVLVSQAANKLVTIAPLGIQRLMLAPLDAKTIYALAGNAGLYRTKDAGDHWEQVFASPVQSLALHPTNSDIIYLASESKILRTANGGQDWQTVYIEPTPKVTIVDLGLVIKTPKTIYAVTNRGVIIRSDNEGASWRQIYFMQQNVLRLYVNQVAPNVLYAAGEGGQLWRSDDGGLNWNELTAILAKQVSLGYQRQFKQFAFLPGLPDGFLYANQQSMYRSPDGGVTWTEVKLVTAPSSISITALVVDPARADDVFYATPLAFYRSTNGGQTWATLPLPASLAPTALVLHPTDGKTIYLGFSH